MTAGVGFADFGNAAWLGLFALIAALGVITLVGVTLLSRPNREIMAGIGSLKIQLGADESNRRNDMTVASKIDALIFQLQALNEQIVNRDMLVDHRFDALDRRVDGLEERVAFLATQILAHPGLPLNTGEQPITPKEPL